MPLTDFGHSRAPAGETGQGARATLEHGLRQRWQQRGAAARLLWPLSLAYGALATRQQARQRRSAQRLPVPVIVIGNVIAGGAGKTPTTLAVAQHLTKRGWRVGIISRGHGRSTRDCREVRPDSTPQDVGDEPLLLRRRSGCPVFVAARRADAGRALLAAHPGTNILICDDGLQHAALARDVDICVFDARGTGNGWLLPAGPLREPWPRPVDFILLTEDGAAPPHAAPAPVFRATRRLAGFGQRVDGAQIPLASLHGLPACALAAIARPEAFFAMLRARGLRLQHTLALPDHGGFERLPAPFLEADVLLCTEKDAAKLWPLAPKALAVPLALDIEAVFFDALDAKLGALHPGK